MGWCDMGWLSLLLFEDDDILGVVGEVGDKGWSSDDVVLCVLPLRFNKFASVFAASIAFSSAQQSPCCCCCC